MSWYKETKEEFTKSYKEDILKVLSDALVDLEAGAEAIEKEDYRDAYICLNSVAKEVGAWAEDIKKEGLHEKEDVNVRRWND